MLQIMNQVPKMTLFQALHHQLPKDIFQKISSTVDVNVNIASSKRSARLTWTTSTNTVILDKTTKALVVEEDYNVVKENQGLHANVITTEGPSTPKTG